MGYFLSPCSPNPSRVLSAKKQIFLVLSDHRSQSHFKFQSCLITEYAGVFFFFLNELGEYFLKPSQTTCGHVGAVRSFFKVFWPRDSTLFYNSPAVVLEESLATQTLLLTVHYDDINTRPLPGSFIDWKFLIVALMVEMGMFPALALFLKSFHSFVKLNCLLLHIRNIFFGFCHCDGWLREFTIYIYVKREAMAG